MPAEAPQLQALVVVEGIADAVAVTAAARPLGGIYILGGASKGGSEHRAAIRMLARRWPVIVLLDADVAGRQGRRALDDALAGHGECWHAFVPSWLSRRVDRRHGRANVGVEHAPTAALRAALLRARPCSDGSAPRAWGAGALRARGLLSAHDERDRDAAREARNRRELACGYLGLGSCSGDQLLKSLNRYGFRESELDAAVAAANDVMARLPYEQYRELMACSIYADG